MRADEYRMNSTGERGEPCGRPALKGLAGSISLSKARLMVQLLRKLLMLPDSYVGNV